MKAQLFKFTTILLLSLSCLKLSAQTPYVGGSLQAAYTTYFDFRPHFLGGYEFNDKWAIGGGVGLDLTATSNSAYAAGFLAAYVRYTPWHNDYIFTDIKWRTEAILKDGINGADLGLMGSLRFRVSDHIDIFTDFLPVGVRYSFDDATPLIGILSNGCTLGLHYRF